MRKASRRFNHYLLLAGTGLLAVGPVRAEPSYPSRAIRWVVPWPVGTPGDLAARMLAERMATSMKQPIVIDNKPGASGTIGYAEALRQPADGHTLYMLSSASLVAPLLYPTRSFEFLKTLEPVAITHWNYNALVASLAGPFKSLGDIVAKAKAEPDSLTYASAGSGSPAHLAGALLTQQAGVAATHVPYQQFQVGVGDVIAGRVSYMFLTTAAAIPQIAGGRLRPIAVTSPNRLAALPDTPTMRELGYPNFVLRSFEGLTVKAGTPKPIVERLNLELNRALAAPEVKARFSSLGWDVEPMQPDQFRDAIAAETAKWLRIGKDARVSSE